MGSILHPSEESGTGMLMLEDDIAPTQSRLYSDDEQANVRPSALPVTA
jgi:hypothetical protein